MARQGALALRTIVVSVLLLFFLISGIAIFAPLFSGEFQTGVRENIVCRASLALSKYLTLPFVSSRLAASCQADRITLTPKVIAQDQQEHLKRGVINAQESTKEATIRYVLEKAIRCRNLYTLPSQGGVQKRVDCYICYAFQKSSDEPLATVIPGEEFMNYMIEAQSPRKKSYLFEIQEDHHNLVFAFENALFTPHKRDYVVTYVDNVKGNKWLSLIVGGGTICTASTFFGPVGKVVGCGVGFLAGAFHGGAQAAHTNYDLVVVTELERAKDRCEEIVTS